MWPESRTTDLIMRRSELATASSQLYTIFIILSSTLRLDKKNPNTITNLNLIIWGFLVWSLSTVHSNDDDQSIIVEYWWWRWSTLLLMVIKVMMVTIRVMMSTMMPEREESDSLCIAGAFSTAPLLLHFSSTSPPLRWLDHNFSTFNDKDQDHGEITILEIGRFPFYSLWAISVLTDL